MKTANLNIEEKHYFPTQIFSCQLEEPEELNAQLLSAIYRERDTDPEGKPRSTFAALGSWHSQTNLFKNSEYAEITDIVTQCAAHVSKSNSYATNRVLKIGTMWSIINPPGSFNRTHIHPSCHWSGVYYVQTPKDCGNIEFIDPRTVNLINPPTYTSKAPTPSKCWGKVNMTPKAGKLFIFPSWLYHGVAPNLSELPAPASNRVIISFNLRQVVKE